MLEAIVCCIHFQVFDFYKYCFGVAHRSTLCRQNVNLKRIHAACISCRFVLLRFSGVFFVFYRPMFVGFFGNLSNNAVFEFFRFLTYVLL